LNLEDEKLKHINVKGYKFKIRYTTPLDRVQIIQRRMNLQNGHPVEAMTEAEYLYFENIAIVDICIEEMPDDFKDNESCLKWEDIELINMVAEEIRKHTEDIQSKLKKNKPIVGSN